MYGNVWCTSVCLRISSHHSLMVTNTHMHIFLIFIWFQHSTSFILTFFVSLMVLPKRIPQTLWLAQCFGFARPTFFLLQRSSSSHNFKNVLKIYEIKINDMYAVRARLELSVLGTAHNEKNRMSKRAMEICLPNPSRNLQLMTVNRWFGQNECNNIII